MKAHSGGPYEADILLRGIDFNNDGTKVAFYQTGAGVSVIDIAAKTVRTVAKTPDWGGAGQEQFMSCPGAGGTNSCCRRI